MHFFYKKLLVDNIMIICYFMFSKIGFIIYQNSMETNFGRYSDSYKPKDKVNFWTSASDLFDKKNYLESYREFVKYLSDDEVGNVTINSGSDFVDFGLIQGSKSVRVHIQGDKVIAESEIAKFDKLSIPFMRRLLEVNYSLYYSRFAIRDDKIIIKFDSNVFDCSPNKLYFALKELATKADKQDDLLLDEFSVLHNVDDSIIEQIPPELKEIKYKYLCKWISGTLNRIGELNENRFDGGISYMLLSLIYKIDYLLVPEGKLTNDIETFSGIYWANDNKKLVEKNIVIKEELKKILEKPKDDIIKSFYKVKATFGVVNPTGYNSITGVINDNMGNVKWYVENNYEDIALAILEYITSYCFFMYGMPKPVRELLNVLMIIFNPDFAAEFGIKEDYFNSVDNKLNNELITEKINKIMDNGRQQFSELKFDVTKLDFSSRVMFISSVYKEMLNLNFNN